jgi:protein-disulfide isomerase
MKKTYISWAPWRFLALFAILAGLTGPAYSAGPELTTDDMVLGKADAPGIMFEYASFTCPACASLHRESLPKLKSELIDTGKVRLVFRPFVRDRNDLDAARLAYCGGKERFFGFVDVIFASQDKWARAQDPRAELGKIGRLGGLSAEQIEKCLRDEDLGNRILKLRLDATQLYSVESTPTMFIAGQKLVGVQSFDTLAKALQPLISK